MKDNRSQHFKIQEDFNRYATTDPPKEMSELKTDDGKDETALKWVALAILHGMNARRWTPKADDPR